MVTIFTGTEKWIGNLYNENEFLQPKEQRALAESSYPRVPSTGTLLNGQWGETYASTKEGKVGKKWQSFCFLLVTEFTPSSINTLHLLFIFSVAPYLLCLTHLIISLGWWDFYFSVGDFCRSWITLLQAGCYFLSHPYLLIFSKYDVSLPAPTVYTCDPLAEFTGGKLMAALLCCRPSVLASGWVVNGCNGKPKHYGLSSPAALCWVYSVLAFFVNGTLCTFQRSDAPAVYGQFCLGDLSDVFSQEVIGWMLRLPASYCNYYPIVCISVVVN